MATTDGDAMARTPEAEGEARRGTWTVGRVSQTAEIKPKNNMWETYRLLMLGAYKTRVNGISRVTRSRAGAEPYRMWFPSICH